MIEIKDVKPVEKKVETKELVMQRIDVFLCIFFGLFIAVAMLVAYVISVDRKLDELFEAETSVTEEQEESKGTEFSYVYLRTKDKNSGYCYVPTNELEAYNNGELDKLTVLVVEKKLSADDVALIDETEGIYYEK